MEDLASGGVQQLANAADSPLLSWPWAAWNQHDTGAAQHEVARNLLTGQTVEFPREVTITGLAGMSAVAGSGNSVYLYDDITKDLTQPRQLNQAFGSDHVTFATLNQRVVGWYEDAIGIVYDRAEQRLVEVSASPQTRAWVGGRLLVWNEPESPAQQANDPPNDIAAPTLDVIDTATLPAPPA